MKARKARNASRKSLKDALKEGGLGKSASEREEATANSVLPLPHSYRFLAEVFKCTEATAAILHNRKEIITLDKLKGSVENMLKKNFSIDYLKQIVTVLPEAYKFTWENVVDSNGKVLSELHIEVNISGGKVQVEEEVQGGGKLGPAQVVKRRAMFAENLQKIVQEHYRKFPSNPSPSVQVKGRGCIFLKILFNYLHSPH